MLSVGGTMRSIIMQGLGTAVWMAFGYFCSELWEFANTHIREAAARREVEEADTDTKAWNDFIEARLHRRLSSFGRSPPKVLKECKYERPQTALFYKAARRP